MAAITEHRPGTRSLAPTAWLILAAACTGPAISAPDFLPLRVDVNVSGDTGSQLRIVLDGIPAAEIDANGGRVTLDVRTGRRVIELARVPAECVVVDGQRQVIDVQPGRAAFVVSFNVSCPGPASALPAR